MYRRGDTNGDGNLLVPGGGAGLRGVRLKDSSSYVISWATRTNMRAARRPFSGFRVFLPGAQACWNGVGRG